MVFCFAGKQIMTDTNLVTLQSICFSVIR